MKISGWLRKERAIWHRRFIPSFIAGISVALITFFFKMTASNIVLFASLGASAAILTHKYIHKLVILRTVVVSYVIALLISLFVLFILHRFNLPFSLLILINVTLVTLSLYLFDVFHPPAVAASLAFILFDGHISEMLLVFAAVIILLILIKLLTYAFYYEELEMVKFMQEFRKLERIEKEKLKKILG